MHVNAPPRTSRRFAAAQQGKFWEMHDALYKNEPQPSTPETIDKGIGEEDRAST